MRKIIFTVSILIVTTVFIGYGQIQDNSPESLPEATVTPTPTSEPAEELPQESIEDTEEQEEETGNSEELFERQLNGVWGNLIGGCYFEQHEGKEITSGWFESDALPKAHITKIEEVAADKYKTTIEVDPWVDEDGKLYKR